MTDRDALEARLRPPQYPFEHRYLEVERHDLHYVDEGSGPVLLLVNVGMWSYVFRDLMLRLRDRFRVVALDFPGLGLSSEVEDFPDVASNSALLERFVDELDLRDVTLLVHDVGGPVGLGWATRRPELVRGLIVANTFAFPLRDYPLIRGMLGLVTSRAFDAINTRTNLFARFSSSSVGVGRHLDADERAAFLVPWSRRSTRQASMAALRSVRGIDPWLEDIEEALTTTLRELPVLTVYGARNDPFGWQRRVESMMPRNQHLRVEGGNHFPFADAPDEVAQAIDSWWDELVAGDGRTINVSGEDALMGNAGSAGHEGTPRGRGHDALGAPAHVR